MKGSESQSEDGLGEVGDLWESICFPLMEDRFTRLPSKLIEWRVLS